MQYVFLFLLAWIVVCFPALIYARVIEGRRQRDREEWQTELKTLSSMISRLEHRLRDYEILRPDSRQPHPEAKAIPPKTPAFESPPVPQNPPAVVSPTVAARPVDPDKPVPVKKPEVEKTPSVEQPAAARVPIPVPLEAPTSPTPPAIIPATAAARLAQPENPVAPKKTEMEKPSAAEQPVAARVQAPAIAASTIAPFQQRPLPPAPPVQLPPPPRSAAPVATASATEDGPAKTDAGRPTQSSGAQYSGILGLTALPEDSPLARAKKPSEKKKSPGVSLSLEETVGTNWLPKLGISILVIGLALLMASQWGRVPPILRIVLFYMLGGGMLLGGTFLERKERYKILGWVLIGGGWATTYITTYGMNHIAAVRVLDSGIADLVLMLIAGAAMAWHTLKYNSQTVTAAAFLLAFAAIPISGDSTALSLVSGAILAAGMTVIVLRRQWFELEIFGILACYLNHAYWLWPIMERMHGNRVSFPEFKESALLLLFYWAVFRASYLLRGVMGKELEEDRESVSTVAALVNPLLFLAVMRYQSFHPVAWGFYPLLAMGALEFTLGQLPAARRRKAPFQVLSSLGATLMAVAVPLRYANSSLELLWMAGAEAFLLAGILTREKLFRRFGMIVSYLVAGYVFITQVVPLGTDVLTGQVHHAPRSALVLAAIAAAFYANSHVIGGIWREFFSEPFDRDGWRMLSFIGSLFAVGAIYSATPQGAVGVALALLTLTLGWAAKRFGITDLHYQAYWIALAATAEACLHGAFLEASWRGVPERILAMGGVAALFYLCSRFARLDRDEIGEMFVLSYRWLAAGLLALLVRFQAPPRYWAIAVLWMALALALTLAGERLKRREFRWQAALLAGLSFLAALTVNLQVDGALPHFSFLSYRMVSVTLVAGGIYWLVRWSPHPALKPAYSWLGTSLLGLLAFFEAPKPWTGVAWIVLAVALALAARIWKDRTLLWQAHLLSVFSVGWTLSVNLSPAYGRTTVQWITVSLVSGLLYLLTWMTNIAEVIEDERIAQAYSWAASLLVSWLAWYQLQPASVSLAWSIFGLALFEIGYNRRPAFLRAQGYVALLCGFGHIFLANFNDLASSGLSPNAYAVLPLAPIYFFVYWRLRAKKQEEGKSGREISLEYLLPWVGAATIAALIRFEMPKEAVASGYAALTVALLLAAWRTRLQVFLHQSLVMLAFTAVRLSMQNFYDLQHAFLSSLSSSIWAIALLAAGVPIAFRLREMQAAAGPLPGWMGLARRPEQPMFFVPVALLAVLLTIRVPWGMVTLAWSIEGIVIFLLALPAKERSFRLTGLGLLLVCFAKVVFWDVWTLNDAAARYLTLIGLGAMMLAVSYLWGKNRETLREYL